MKFELNETEKQEARKFQQEHAKTCSMEYFGAINGRWSYKFSMTSLGCTVILSCACGEQENITDFSDW